VGGGRKPLRKKRKTLNFLEKGTSHVSEKGASHEQGREVVEKEKNHAKSSCNYERDGEIDGSTRRGTDEDCC